MFLLHNNKMAEEPQPASVHEGAQTPAAPASSAEDRKAAAAMSKLDAHQHDDEAAAPKKGVDAEALGKAMKNLDIKENNNVPPKKEETKKVVKVNPADVALLVRERCWWPRVRLVRCAALGSLLIDFLPQVDQLELTKPKATELLKANEGDLVKAMTAFVAVS